MLWLSIVASVHLTSVVALTFYLIMYPNSTGDEGMGWFPLEQEMSLLVVVDDAHDY